jgi:HEAT repeat protein
MNMRARKAAVRQFLRNRDLEPVRHWAGTVRSPLRTLFSLTFDHEELLRWRAVEAIGQVAAEQARPDPERVRDFLRRLLWQMNDESGGLSWLSPEIIGEILVNVPSLAGEYGPLLLSYLHEEPFERGAHQAISRLASKKPDVFSQGTSLLAESLENPDPAIRALAAAALGAIDTTRVDALLERFRNDGAVVNLYDFASGTMRAGTVSEFVTEALDSGRDSEQAA